MQYNVLIMGNIWDIKLVCNLIYTWLGDNFY